MCMSDPPRRPAEPADTEARTLARIQSELAMAWRPAGFHSPEQTLERIAGILAAAGYAAPGAEGARTERFVWLWWQGGLRQG